MSLSEILLIIIVAIIVFGPQRLPQLSSQLGKFIAYLNHWHTKATTAIEHQQKIAQLEQNHAKAALADQKYQNPS